MSILSDTQLLTAQSAVNTAAAIPQSEYAIRTEVDVVFGAGTSAGAVMLESAHDPAYTGTWHTEATATWSAATKAVHLSLIGMRRALRVRISTAIVGGTVDAYAKVSDK